MDQETRSAVFAALFIAFIVIAVDPYVPAHWGAGRRTALVFAIFAVAWLALP